MKVNLNQQAKVIFQSLKVLVGVIAQKYRTITWLMVNIEQL